MNLDGIKLLINNSLSKIYNEHRFLFDNIKNIKEETFNHYFANEIANNLVSNGINNYDVDVEYSYAFQINTESEAAAKTYTPPTSTTTVHKIPDIIVHKRGPSTEPHNNMIIIECKKLRDSSKDHVAVKSFVNGDGINTAAYQFGVVIIYMQQDKKSKIYIYHKNESLELSICEYTHNHEPPNQSN